MRNATSSPIRLLSKCTGSYLSFLPYMQTDREPGSYMCIVINVTAHPVDHPI